MGSGILVLNGFVRLLKVRLTPDSSEGSVADLLATRFPGIAAVRGASDSGQGGAIGDGRSDPFPVVTTTAGWVKGTSRCLMSGVRLQPGKGAIATNRASTMCQRRHRRLFADSRNDKSSQGF